MVAGALVKANISALAYHAGLKDDQRSMVQQRWVLEDRCKVRTYSLSKEESSHYGIYNRKFLRGSILWIDYLYRSLV